MSQRLELQPGGNRPRYILLAETSIPKNQPPKEDILIERIPFPGVPSVPRTEEMPLYERILHEIQIPSNVYELIQDQIENPNLEYPLLQKPYFWF